MCIKPKQAQLYGVKMIMMDRTVDLLVTSAPAMNRKIHFDVSNLALEFGGSGDPALFVHGFGSSKSSWRRVCRGLGDVFSFYAIDLPGFGESPAPRHFQYTLENFADALTDFITTKDLKKLTLVGTSLGASIILLAILRNKVELAPRVRSLCLHRRHRLPPALFILGRNASDIDCSGSIFWFSRHGFAVAKAAEN